MLFLFWYLVAQTTYTAIYCRSPYPDFFIDIVAQCRSIFRVQSVVGFMFLQRGLACQPQLRETYARIERNIMAFGKVFYYATGCAILVCS